MLSTKEMREHPPASNGAIHLSRFIRPDNAPFPMLHVDVMCDRLPTGAEWDISDYLDEFCKKTEASLKAHNVIPR